MTLEEYTFAHKRGYDAEEVYWPLRNYVFDLEVLAFATNPYADDLIAQCLLSTPIDRRIPPSLGSMSLQTSYLITVLHKMNVRPKI